MTLLEVENLQTEFQTDRGTVRAVNGVDLSIDRGEIVGLVGESGSGKSVLATSILQMVEGNGEIVEGDVRFEGTSLRDKTEKEMQKIRGNRISIAFQDAAGGLNPTLTVGEQIAESIRLHQDTGESTRLSAEIKRKILGASKNTESWRRAIEMLESVQIPAPESRADDYPHEFSGGMQQRAMIAMALSCEPDILIADEPTTGLDVTIQAQILEELKSLRSEFETAILFITHDLGVVSETCDRVNVMYAGEIIEKAPTRELFDNPQHPYTQQLLRSTPRLDDPQEELTAITGNVPDLIDIPYACHFAPRCGESTKECFEIEPKMRVVGENEDANHIAACHYRGISESERPTSTHEAVVGEDQ
ncbi:ABC transporter ATP-binding protein [Halorubrum ejinorense]|uniref:Nickel import system ATP-binding protein NikD n=1 Tax=Halorubrum ejinorense TaxID=425309 RepID=A0AAV3SSP6_9EURY